MNGIPEDLRMALRDFEYAVGYAESFLDTFVGTQIKVLREQRGMSQVDLAVASGTSQSAMSRNEDVNYSRWSVGTLKRIAEALSVRLHISFEPFGTLPLEVDRFSRDYLERPPHANDPMLWADPSTDRVGDLIFMPGRSTQHEITTDTSGTHAERVEKKPAGSSWLGNLVIQSETVGSLGHG